MIGDLYREARFLRHMLSQFEGDLAFLASHPHAAFIDFIDAHDVMAYIEPNRKGNLYGFILNVEQELHRQDDEFMRTTMLKSELVLRELLFESPWQVGLLPPHVEELEEEIAYHMERELRERNYLIDEAKRQIRTLKQDKAWRRTEALLCCEPHDPATQRLALESVRHLAPALMRLLCPGPALPRERISALLQPPSKLVPMHDIYWEAFGFNAEWSGRLHTVRPDEERVETWQSYLGGIRLNSIRANRIDAEALAFIEALEAQLAVDGGPLVRVRFVTRAPTLKGTSKRGLDFLSFSRHPRLLALRRNCGIEVGCERFSVALATYYRQLKSLSDDTEAQKEAVTALQKAWADFENARFTGNLRSPSLMAEPGPTEIRILLDWLRSDDDFLRLVHEDLVKSVTEFETATYTLLGGCGQRASSWIRMEPDANGSQVRIVPLRSDVGPVILHSPVFGPVHACRDDLARIVETVGLSAVDRYLCWAVMLACEGRWALAAVYARAAALSAHTSPGQGRSALEEARLLQAQIWRLGGPARDETDTSSPDHTRRGPHRDAVKTVIDARNDLDAITNDRDPRIGAERGAQLLERRLTSGADAEDSEWALRGLALLEQAAGHAADDPLVLSRILALQIAYHLAGQRRRDLWPDYAHAALVGPLRRRLHTLLTYERTLRSDEISGRARAFELIGFQLNADGNQASSSPDENESRPRIPGDLRAGVSAILEELRHSTDQIALLAAQELERILILVDG
jgi:hypothetical protein